MSGGDERCCVIRVPSPTVDLARSHRIARHAQGWIGRWKSSQGPTALGDIYWPIDLSDVTATVKLPFRSSRSVRMTLAYDAVSARLGVVDISLPQLEEVRVHDRAVMSAVRECPDDEWWEYGRNQLIRRFRPIEIAGLRVVDRERIYVPYQVFRSGARTILVDRMMGRPESPYKLTREDVRSISSMDATAVAVPEHAL